MYVCETCGRSRGPIHECDEWDVTLVEMGYIYCRPHGDWHRGNECAINERGEPLHWCGKPFDHEGDCDEEAEPLPAQSIQK